MSHCNPVAREALIDAHDKLNSCLTKAHAMIVAINGERFSGFTNLNDDLQSEYIWAVSDMVGDARRALDIINEADFLAKGSALSAAVPKH